MVRTGLILCLLVLAGCATTAPASVGADFCKVQSPYTPPRSEVQHVAKATYTTGFLVSLNAYGQSQCGWKPPAQAAKK